ncbi:MAG: hypothetical protein Q9195_007913 [Heterodermia aff. obscurata]
MRNEEDVVNLALCKKILGKLRQESRVEKRKAAAEQKKLDARDRTPLHETHDGKHLVPFNADEDVDDSLGRLKHPHQEVQRDRSLGLLAFFVRPKLPKGFLLFLK